MSYIYCSLTTCWSSPQKSLPFGPAAILWKPSGPLPFGEDAVEWVCGRYEVITPPPGFSESLRLFYPS